MSRIDEALNRASGRVGKTSELNRHSSGAVPMDSTRQKRLSPRH